MFPDLLDEGVERTVGGNTPFFLDDPASAWLVLTGKVEVFCDTALQQGAGTVSRDQRQRLMIARDRARPPILVFDELTSALDNRTQAIVTNSFERLQATRIAIAHRLSTILGADRTYVLENGRLVEEGNYAQLAAGDGLFANLIRRQVA